MALSTTTRILRPRLVEMLRAADARVVVLVGPTGYGKTTLARQWLHDSAPSVVWFRATAACLDVAALASGLAAAATILNSGAALAVRQQLAHSLDAEVHAEALARVLSAALPDAPSS